MEDNKTIGAHAVELMQKEPETRSPIDIQREVHRDWEKHVVQALNTGMKMFPGDFYLVVETKKEQLMENVLRNYFYTRESCPTPIYDTSVFKYHRQEEMLEFLWVLPSKDTCILLRENAIKVDKSERELLNFVLDFYDGTLDVRCKKLNGEIITLA